MRHVFLFTLAAACASCHHAPTQGAEKPDTSAFQIREEYLGRTTYRILNGKQQFWIIASELPPEPVDTVGLRLEVRGCASMALVRRGGDDQPVEPTDPPGDAKGVLVAPSRRVDIRLLKPIPAGQPISPSVQVDLDVVPASDFRLAITPILARDPGPDPAPADPYNGLDTGTSFSHMVDGKEVWEKSYMYQYRGWTWDPHPHASLTIPVEAPHADSFQIEDLLPDGATGVRVEAAGFRLGSLRIDAHDVGLRIATVDGVEKKDSIWGSGNASASLLNVPSGMAQARAEFRFPVPPDSAGAIRIWAAPLDPKVPLKGTLKVTYLMGGE